MDSFKVFSSRKLDKTHMEEPKSADLLIELFIVVIAGIFQFFILFSITTLPCSSFGCCGGDYLYLRDGTLQAFSTAIVVVILQFIVAFIFYKSRMIMIGFSLCMMAIVTSLVAVVMWTKIPNISGYYEEFDAQKWQQEKPVEMVRTFHKDKRFIGKTSSEVIGLLGEDYREYHDSYYLRMYRSTDAIYYPIYHKFSDLIFIFKDDKVVHYTLECDNSD